MAAYVSDSTLIRRLKAERKRSGADRFDEVWEGVYFMPPLANDEHQNIATGLGTVFVVVIGWPGLGEVRVGINVSDREKGWTFNFRCPDVAVFLTGTAAKNCGTHWWGGPDFAVEILSRGDRGREKFDFYAKVAVRELLLIDRKPWALELYRLTDGEFELVGKATVKRPTILKSEVLPLTFNLRGGKPRPVIWITHADGRQSWSV
jgi:Uma2 family endonuclease